MTVEAGDATVGAVDTTVREEVDCWWVEAGDTTVGDTVGAIDETK